MAPKICYEKDDVEKENETTANVTYDVHDNKQSYQNKKCTKGLEKHCFTKYKAGAGKHRSASRSSAGRTVSHRSRSASKSNAFGVRRSRSPAGSRVSMSRSSNSENGRRHSANSKRSRKESSGKSQRSRSRSLSRVEQSAKCYDVKRGKKGDPCDREAVWQNGKYVRDDCGSGIVPRRFDFKPSRKIWCKTPLTMYQATIGELARKILCREKVVPRDVKPAPPCNIEEYILPLCRGYYRKYDCLRPCEEEHAYFRGGKKQYRDRVERYWEPCYSKDQKIKLDINEYAPHNAYLAKKMRRFNMQTGSTNLPCW